MDVICQCFGFLPKKTKEIKHLERLCSNPEQESDTSVQTNMEDWSWNHTARLSFIRARTDRWC